MDKTQSINDRVRVNRECVPELRPPFPKKIMVELTNSCNAKCVFCANRRMTRKPGFMDKRLYERIADEASSLGCKEIGFHATGEPLLSPILKDAVAIAKKKGFEYAYITTNGVLATEGRIRPVIDAGLDSIKFSINGGTAGTYKMIHGTDGFENVLANLRWISGYRKQNSLPLKIYVSYVMTRQNRAESVDFKRLVAPMIDDISFYDLANPGGIMGDVTASYQADPAGHDSRPPCSLLFTRAHVTCEGYLTICCLDYQNYLTVEDLNAVSLKEAWHNDLFVEVRKRHIENRLEGMLCYNCYHKGDHMSEPLLPRLATAYDHSVFSGGRE